MRHIVQTVLLALLGPAAFASAQSYPRAEQFLTWNLLTRVYHDQVQPNWYPDSVRFWYRVHTREGLRVITVDPRAGSRAPLAEAPSTPIAEARMVQSPDRQWNAFIAGFNLWIRPAAGGDSIALTSDGIRDFGYGVRMPNASLMRRPTGERPALFWSPDSRRIAIFRYDERGVRPAAILSVTPTRPVLYQYPYALPGDSIVPTSDVYIVDLSSRSSRRVEYPAQPVPSRYGGGQASLYGFGGDDPIAWGQRSDRVYFNHSDRGPKRVRLIEAEVATGRARVVLADSSATSVIGGVDPTARTPNWRVLRNGDVVFFSERDGFAHLYRFGPEGILRNQITRGPWMVMSLLAVDEGAGRIWFTAAGREAGRHPDYRHLYAINLDGTGLMLLSPEDADHAITPVPGGPWFIDTWSRIDQPPVTVLRTADGRVVSELERADITDLQGIGWRPGEMFTARARDGVTELHGVIWKPSNFDSTRSYPVIDHIYPGPLFSPVDKGFFPPRGMGLSYATMGQAQALAELGFIVVEIDALGNGVRPKASRESWWGDMGDNGLPDHVAVLKELGARFPWLDLNRVGIYGYSGGGFASTAALLRYPEFYRVAVSIAGNHDNRSYNFGWGERFQGPLRRDSASSRDNYEGSANKRLAGQLQGHLLLIHGDLDDNVHPGHTMQLVDALIKANKTFDLLIVPDAGHGMIQHPYVIRRTWDYFVEHLLGVEPPRNYRIGQP